MGILDSILKKKPAEVASEGDDSGAPAAESVAAEPAPVKAKSSAAQKLIKVLDHLEKIILGMVLVAVAAISVMKVLAAKKDSEELEKNLDGAIDYMKKRTSLHVALQKKVSGHIQQ